MKLGAPPRRGDLSFGAGYPARPPRPIAASDNGSSPSHRLQANRRQAGPSTQPGEKGASMPFEGSFEDRLALRDLLDAYADAVNRADSEAWAATWDQGGRWSLPGFGIFEGKAKIVDTWRAAMRAFPDIVFRAWPGSIEVHGETAAMRSYTEEVFLRDGTLHRTLGIYDDVCRRIDGRWLFTERRFRPLPQLSRSEVQS